MKKVALALLVVLTVASVSFAGWTPTGNVVPIDNGNPNFNTYIVGLSVDGVNGITSVSDVTVTGGNVVQYKKYDMDNEVFLTTPGPFTSTADAYLFDTHMLDLSVYGEGVTAAGDGWAETNDESLTGDLTTSSFRKYGLGDLVLANDPSTLAVNNAIDNLNQIDFVQVCIPAGTSALVTGLYTNTVDADAGVAMVPFEFTVGIPEPSTIVMLVLGALCLLGIRRK